MINKFPTILNKNASQRTMKRLLTLNGKFKPLQYL